MYSIYLTFVINFFKKRDKKLYCPLELNSKQESSKELMKIIAELANKLINKQNIIMNNSIIVWFTSKSTWLFTLLTDAH